MLIKDKHKSEANTKRTQSEHKANTKQRSKMSMTSTPKSWMDSEFGYKKEYVDDDVEEDDDDYIYNEDNEDDYYYKNYENEEEEYDDDTNDP